MKDTKAPSKKLTFKPSSPVGAKNGSGGSGGGSGGGTRSGGTVISGSSPTSSGGSSNNPGATRWVEIKPMPDGTAL